MSKKDIYSPLKPITCDQVAWIIDSLERLAPLSSAPNVSRSRRMLILGALYEIMEVSGLVFEDDDARYNAMPEEVRPKPEEVCIDEQPEKTSGKEYRNTGYPGDAGTVEPH